MFLRIIKQTVVNGKTAKIGDKFEERDLNIRDAKILLATRKAEIVRAPATTVKETETAEARPEEETADSSPKRGRGRRAK